MKRCLSVFLLLLAGTTPAGAAGLLIPVEKSLPPLAMLNHQVEVTIDDQVAITRVEQTFRNHTDRQLEATYIFPVPKGASVRKFSMWVDGKEVPGELVEAKKARDIYTSIVQRTLDPGLLEYMDNSLLRLRVFPVPPRGDQKVAISYTSVADKDSDLIEYRYPLKTDAKAASTLEKFSVKVVLKSQHPLTNIYSPSHAVTVSRPNDRHATIAFEKDQALLDRDFQLFYSAGGKDVGLTALATRPSADAPGYFMLLASPRAELSKERQVPRDMVFVLDTSGSMRGKRMTQAQNALKYCLSNLGPRDRFGLMNFATTVNKYTERLLPASSGEVERARKWVDTLEATGGTAIQDALDAALAMRSSKSEGRTFTVVFFTDGRPTIGETDAEKILKSVTAKNSASTRIFTFGVGDDVNASMLDRLADDSRAISTYVREAEDIEAKVSSLYSKISNPVLTNLKLSVGEDVKIAEVYPPKLPDLFHGTQLVVLGRYTGKGPVEVKLTGQVENEVREFTYKAEFPERTAEERPFVEDLWARRKVGYLLDQIRASGEKKEVVDEVVALAKKYGITTPYTSYLVVPDSPIPVVNRPGPLGGPRPVPLILAPAGGGGVRKLAEVAKELQAKGDLADRRGALEEKRLEKAVAAATEAGKGGKNKEEAERLAGVYRDAQHQKKAFDKAQYYLRQRQLDGVQNGALGVDLAVQCSNLRNQTQMAQSAVRRVQNRNCLEVGGVWIDEGYDAKMKTVTVKAMSNAYFRILERHKEVRQVFQLGNHLVWVSPSGTALIVDANDGQQEMSDADIDRLFVAAPAPNKSDNK